jgi:metallo-beta-lactamase family protein
MPPVDYLICESTYGGKVHESRVNSDHRLLEIVRKTCVENKGKLIIPSFSVGRTQEVVLALNTLHESGELPEIPVYVDSPLAINATQVFMMHPECFDKEMYEFMRSDPNPFGFNTLRYIKNVDDSKKLNDSSEPCIIISASGMAEAGRIKHHLFNHIEDPLSTVLFVGYCTPGSLGGQLLAGKESVYIFGEDLKVNAAIQSIDAYSAHADQPEILQFLKLVDKSRLNKIFLVHGEPDRQLALKDALISEGYMDIELPEQGQEFICN